MQKPIFGSVESIGEILSSLIKDVTVKSLFSGYGFYQGIHMFGILQSGIFYLRGEGDLAVEYEKNGGIRCQTTKNHALSLHYYYTFPQEVFENRDLLKTLLLASIKQVERKKRSVKGGQKQIRDMLNLSIKHERFLAKVGITSVYHLRQLGAENAYILLKKAGIPVNIEFYWSLYAALRNVHRALLGQEEKNNALIALNKKLAEANLRDEK